MTWVALGIAAAALGLSAWQEIRIRQIHKIVVLMDDIMEAHVRNYPFT